jgi:CDP-diacylglycerol--glycerol-3-phosphate 3-phosphatidyltransferase
VIIGRELAVTGLRSVASSRGRGFPASPLGKIKMAAQVIAILLLILGENGTEPFLILGQIALWVVLLTALVSAFDYYRAYASAPQAPLTAVPPDIGRSSELSMAPESRRMRG